MPRSSSDHRPRASPLTFLGCHRPYRASRVTILGCPLDLTVSYRPGSRFAPNAIREASWNLESYSPALQRDLEELPLCDLGDLPLPYDLQAALAEIRKAVKGLLADGKTPLLLGGEHLLTLGAVQAIAEVHPDLRVLQLDAHADLRAEYQGTALCHATVMRRVAELLGPKRVLQVGIRSWDRREREEAEGLTLLLDEGPEAPLPPDLHGGPLYLTLDLDVLDPSVCPGVGAPEPGGWTFRELLGFLYRIPWERVVAADIVELCPPYDPYGISASVAAKVTREILLLLG